MVGGRRRIPAWRSRAHPGAAPRHFGRLRQGGALQALAWAKAHPQWRDDHPALEAVDSVTGTSTSG
jgi:hypothetical protein